MSTWELGTSQERVEAVKRYIAEREKLADELRGQALGNTVEGAAKCLRDAEVCAAIGEGMKRALGILFP